MCHNEFEVIGMAEKNTCKHVVIIFSTIYLSRVDTKRYIWVTVHIPGEPSDAGQIVKRAPHGFHRAISIGNMMSRI